jgi:tRNA-dihydrouridine synthase A
MLGRAAYHTPWILAEAERRFFGGDAPQDRFEAVARLRPYIARKLADGVWLSRITRHILGLFHGEPGGRLWRRILSEEAHRTGAGLDVIDRALAAVARAQLAAAA